jgi:hypothetical protein
MKEPIETQVSTRLNKTSRTMGTPHMHESIEEARPGCPRSSLLMSSPRGREGRCEPTVAAGFGLQGVRACSPDPLEGEDLKLGNLHLRCIVLSCSLTRRYLAAHVISDLIITIEVCIEITTYTKLTLIQSNPAPRSMGQNVLS